MFPSEPTGECFRRSILGMTSAPSTTTAGPLLEDVVAAARQGDPAAWQEIVARFEPLVRATASRYRVRSADVDDVAQVVWLRLFENLEKLREPRALPGWIAVTTAHECARTVTRAGRTVCVDPSEYSYAHRAAVDADATETPGEALLRAEARSAVRAGLERLPQRSRDLLGLIAQEPRLSYAEISRRLDMPQGSIGPTMARCLKKLGQTADVRTLTAA